MVELDEVELVEPLELDELLSVEPEPNRLVVWRKPETVLVEELDVEDALDAVDVDEVLVVELEELAPPPPGRMPRRRGAERVMNLSAVVTPVSRMLRRSVPDATTAVRMPTLPPPFRTGSVSRL